MDYPKTWSTVFFKTAWGSCGFGTWNGLCRFDGYTFKEFQRHSVTDNFIYSICEDLNKNLWIGTNSGANLYLYQHDKFISFNEDTNLHSLRNKRINALLATDDCLLWVGSDTGLEIFNIDRSSNPTYITSFNFGNHENELTGSTVNHIFDDSIGNIWISTNKGLCVLKKGTSFFVKYTANVSDNYSLPHNSVKCCFEDSEGIIWVGTEGGVSKYESLTGYFTNYSHDPLVQNTLVHNSVMSITEDVSGQIIFGTLGGISIYKKDGSDKFLNYKQNPDSDHALNNDFVNCVYSDKWGNIWIGTERGGINKYNSSKTEFEYFKNEQGNPNSLNNNTINSILEDEKYLWIGTAGGGLNRYDINKKKFKHYVNNPNEPTSLTNNFVTSLCRDKDNNLWIGTWGGGLHKLINENTSNETFEIFRPDGSQSSLVDNFISSLILDPDGSLWIGTAGGLDKLNPETGEFEHINEQLVGMSIEGVGCLELDGDGNVWFGARTGLYKLSKQQSSSTSKEYILSVFNSDSSRTNSLSGNYVISVFNDSYGNIWAGTYGYGLNKLIVESEGGVFERYSISNGLPNNIIYTVLEDLAGNLWLTTDNGLSKFNVKEKIFYNYFIADGLQNNQYYWAASYINNAGKLYLGGMKGLDTFYPDQIKGVHSQTNIVITDFRIYNESVIPEKEYDGIKVMSKSILTTSQIILSYKSNEFGFEFSSLDYDQPTMSQYKYKLEGFEDDWVKVNANRRFANYTNIKPGDYVFKVGVINRNLDESSEAVASVGIKIVPPFWETIWFKLVVIIFILSLIISFNRFRVFSLKIQKRKLELQVKERTTEIENQKAKLEEKNIQLANRQELIEGQNEKLEVQNEQILKQRDKLIELNKRIKMVNQLKLRFFTNISHEFRTPLSLILGPLEELLVNEKDTSSKNYKTLSLISRNAQRLLQLINQLMDFRKLEQGKMKLLVSKVDISGFLTDILSSFSILAEKKNIKLEFTPNSALKDVFLDFQKIENVIYNLLSNSFKYTPENGKIWVRYYKSSDEELSDELLVHKDHLIIEVGDTGCGISQDNIMHIFERFYQIESEATGDQPEGTGIGLSLAKDLIRVHKGEIKVSSKEGEGTIFYLHIPYKKENYDDDLIKELSYNPMSIQQQATNLINEFLSRENRKVLNIKKLNKHKGKPFVLIVEDNDDLRDFLALKLNEKYNVEEASNGREAYEYAIINNPDIIVSDIMMPVMDGLEFCSRIKTNLVTSHIPLILLSAKGSVENQIDGLEAGADKCLPKPINFELLEAHISSLIESRKKLFETFRIKDKIKSENITTTSTDEKFMNKVLQIVEANLGNSEFNLDTILGQLNISRSLLHRKITALTNQSTVEFINNIRLKKSIDMLKNSDLNISEVAYAVGFNDPKYFSRIFRKQFGKTPTEYQKGTSQNN